MRICCQPWWRGHQVPPDLVREFQSLGRASPRRLKSEGVLGTHLVVQRALTQNVSPCFQDACRLYNFLESASERAGHGNGECLTITFCGNPVVTYELVAYQHQHNAKRVLFIELTWINKIVRLSQSWTSAVRLSLAPACHMTRHSRSKPRGL
jgi:hypothetical protein